MYVFHVETVRYVDPDGHFFIAALIGAIIGGITNAITGGDVVDGVISGAIGGTIFGFVGNITQNAGQGMKILAHTVGGAGSGAAGAAATEGNIGDGALIGGLSAGFTEAIDGSGFLPEIDDSTLPGFIGGTVQRGAVGGVVGGTTSAIMGNEFVDGFQQGALTSGVAYATNLQLHEAGKFVYESIVGNRASYTEATNYNLEADLQVVEEAPFFSTDNPLFLLVGGTGFKGANFARKQVLLRGSKYYKHLGKQLNEHGVKSIFTALKSTQKRLLSHTQKVSSLHYKSSVYREIKTFQRQVDTIKQFIVDKGLK